MYDDLITLAEHIAKFDRARPKQAHLRRAVSTAYYAVFHFLIDEACCAQMGTQHAQRGFRYALGRGFTHTVMKSACGSFAGGQLPSAVLAAITGNKNGSHSIPIEIQNVAALFKELQEKRHLADYDLSERFKRSEVLMLIDQVKQHVAAFARFPLSDDRKFFLASLWAWKELQHR